MTNLLAPALIVPAVPIWDPPDEQKQMACHRASNQGWETEVWPIAESAS